MLCIFIHDPFQNKLQIVGCWLELSLSVKYARNKSRGAWSLPVWDSDKTVKWLRPAWFNFHFIFWCYIKYQTLIWILLEYHCLYIRWGIWNNLFISYKMLYLKNLRWPEGQNLSKIKLLFLPVSLVQIHFSLLICAVLPKFTEAW